MDSPKQDNPWLKMAGIWDKNDLLVQEWIEIMAENCRREDENLDYPWEESNESTSV